FWNCCCTRPHHPWAADAAAPRTSCCAEALSSTPGTPEGPAGSSSWGGLASACPAGAGSACAAEGGGAPGVCGLLSWVCADQVLRTSSTGECPRGRSAPCAPAGVEPNPVSTKDLSVDTVARCTSSPWIVL